ncbi:UDP-N-acetylglucosamine diphosphorylase/glucosamine-1-phosphate N-acetyltransferase [Maribacter dokdonensis]|uniref:UDP-N-acetylglucosamine diphosphorylase/glucosamine-1-phosphate N-acetyltransferase n=1 Tax=Maribacter dokdonensis TaxID=320912 RepID=A0ABY0U8K3_9FLAO|nr:GlmU family protein [Maribacter dokdonensis]KSA14074.1 Glucose-1-phosphate thymidylyltransferase [Maribacter dokdonensis DSW-8]SDS24959.1 UDP-N-acetylglucosamine diphosphorylase/glucosamine-1-phosphate N-acetyltransferase [Maribacter dokdonensis]
MNFILFDGPRRDHLLPFTFTRPVSEIRVGILTLRERWEAYLKVAISSLTEDYLSIKYPVNIESENVFIDASVLPTPDLVNALNTLEDGQVLKSKNLMIAYCSSHVKGAEELASFSIVEFNNDLVQINNTWDIFDKNADILQSDFDFITKGRKSQPISETNQLIHPERIFLEEGAKVEFSILNATDGPIYLGKNAEIWEGSLVRGALALCNNAIIKMGGKLYGATTIGPYSKVCGEVSNSVIFGYSSKGHEGYLGNAVLGEWCNIGADSNNSNLKNNYAKVRLWDYATERFEQTGLQFCGLMMGDHSKTAINTMFNTGTVIGVNSNIYVPGFPRNFVPSFSWGGASGFTAYQPAKAFDAAKVMMARRGVEFNEIEADILTHVFEITKKWRKY